MSSSQVKQRITIVNSSSRESNRPLHTPRPPTLMCTPQPHTHTLFFLRKIIFRYFSSTVWSVWFYISKSKKTLILTLVPKINFIKTGISGVSSSPEALGSTPSIAKTTVRSRTIRENYICMFNSSLLKLCLGTMPSTSPSACSALEANSLPLEHP